MTVKKIISISLLQLVIFNSWRSKADAEMVESCVFSKMNLTCNETKVINISSVVLGDSPGCPDAKCCPKNNSCTVKPNVSHVNEVHRRCNGRLTCTVDAIQEKIPCEWTIVYGYHNNDFERITYICIDDRRTTTGALKTTLSADFHADKTKETSELTHDDISAFEDYTYEPEYTSVTGTSISEDVMISNEPEMLKGTEPMTIIIAIVCLLVLIIIIVLIIVIVKRKKSSSKTKPEVEMTDVRNGQNRINANQNQDTNGNPNSRQNDRQNCASTTYEEPNNVVEYSVVNQETRPAADGAGVEYCSIDIVKSDHKTTKSEDDGYSLAGDPDAPTCVENVYEDVESKQSASKAKSVNIHSDGGAYEEPQAVPSGQSKLQQECHRKDEKSVSNSKVDEGIYKNIGEVGTPSSPSSPYEPMTPIPGQNVYANESEVTFRTDSLASSLGSGSEAHTPYCEMRSPSAKLKDDGAHMLVDNELYSSH